MLARKNGNENTIWSWNDSCTGHCGDTGGGQPPPPTVPSVRHAGAMVVIDRYAWAHGSMQEGGGAKLKTPGSGGEEGSHIQGVQRVWTSLGDGDLLQIIGAGDLSGI